MFVIAENIMKRPVLYDTCADCSLVCSKSNIKQQYLSNVPRTTKCPNSWSLVAV